MEAKNEFLERVYKQAKANRVVLTMGEYAKRLGISRAQLYKIIANPEEITEDIINKAKALNYETNNVHSEVSDYKEKYLTALEEIRELQKKLLEGKDSGDKNSVLKKAN